MKLLLFGKNGQVGWELQRSLQGLGDVTALGRDKANFLKPETLRKIILDLKPDIIINAAAYTAVDLAETDVDSAEKINHHSVAIIAEATKKIDAFLIHYSTDYVFDGKKEGAYIESDPPAPQSVYARTKNEGELAILNTQCHAIIFRTSWVYGLNGHNFARTMLKFFQSKNELKIINDQFGAPTGADLIADVTTKILYDLISHNKLSDPICEIYHLVASGKTNWYEYAKFLMSESIKLRKNFNLDIENIHSIAHTQYPTAAKRSLNSCLSTRKLEKAFNLKMPDWKIGVTRYLKQLLEKEVK